MNLNLKGILVHIEILELNIINFMFINTPAVFPAIHSSFLVLCIPSPSCSNLYKHTHMIYVCQIPLLGNRLMICGCTNENVCNLN